MPAKNFKFNRIRVNINNNHFKQFNYLKNPLSDSTVYSYINEQKRVVASTYKEEMRNIGLIVDLYKVFEISEVFVQKNLF